MIILTMMLAFWHPMFAAGGTVTAAAGARFDVVTVARADGAFAAYSPDGHTIATNADVALAVNAAIDRVAQQGGGTVLIAAGDYTLDSPIRVKPGVRLVGEGGLFPDYAFRTDYPTRLRSGARDLGALVDMTEARGARLEHLVIDGAGKTADCVKAAGYAIRVRDCVIKGATRRGLWFTAGQDETHDAYVQEMAINSLFEDLPIGLENSPDPAVKRRGGSTDGMVYQCRFKNCREIGAAIGGGWQFLDNRLSGPGMAAGVTVRGGICMITDNIFENIAPGPAIRLAMPGACVTGNRFCGIEKSDWIAVAAPADAPRAAKGGKSPAAKGGKAPAKKAGGPQAAKAGGSAAPAGGAHQADNEALGSAPPAAPAPPAPSAPPPHVTVSMEDSQCIAIGPDGATLESGPDAAAVINAALRKEQSDGHGVVFIRAGVYLLKSPVLVPAGARLVGEGGMNPEGKTYASRGTILRASAGQSGVLVDMTDAHEARLEQLAVDGGETAECCVKMAGRKAQIRDCYLLNAKDVVLRMTNGNAAGPDAHSGMALIDSLIHSNRAATCLKVNRDPVSKGSAPSKGEIVNSRLMMGKVQGIFAGGEGWRYVGIHATSGGGSTMGIMALSKGLYIAGSYFDSVAAGPHLRVEADDVTVVGCYLGRAPEPGRSIVVKQGCQNLTLTANSGQRVDNLPADSATEI